MPFRDIPNKPTGVRPSNPSSCPLPQTIAGTSTVSREGLLALDQILQDNPFDFELCTQLINGFAHLGDEASVTRYREHAASYCPTTEEFWMGWIVDCKEKLLAALTVADELAWERHIVQLYRGSVAACPSADLWVSYLKFLKQRRAAGTAPGGMNRAPPISQAHIRRTCESAIRDLGLHGTEGPKIWSFYRHIEQSTLQELFESLSSACSEPSTAAQGNETDRKSVV